VAGRDAARGEQRRHVEVDVDRGVQRDAAVEDRAAEELRRAELLEAALRIAVGIEPAEERLVELAVEQRREHRQLRESIDSALQSAHGRAQVLEWRRNLAPALIEIFERRRQEDRAHDALNVAAG